MPVGYPSNVLVIADYDKHNFDEQVRFRIDFFLSLGDNAIQALKDLYDRYRKPIFAVRGDKDGRTPFPKGLIDIHLRVETYRNWTIGGFGGTLWQKEHGPHMWSDTEARHMLEDMPYCDIFICHNPVAGLTNEGENIAEQGSEAIREYITEKKPKIVYHAHTPGEWSHKRGETAIIGIHGWKVIHL
jgi:Icc-related predicted phosphoesterase